MRERERERDLTLSENVFVRVCKKERKNVMVNERECVSARKLVKDRE